MPEKKEPYQFDNDRFKESVVKLRIAQKAYYDCTKGTQKALKCLQEAKKWERYVDMLICFLPPKAE